MSASVDHTRAWLEISGEQFPSAYTLIDRMRYKAKQLFNREYLSDLWALLYGYRFATILHNIRGNACEASFDYFQDWLEHTINAGTESWYKTLLTKAGSEEAAFHEFFALLDAYRALPEFKT